MELVLKTSGQKCLVGSNPTASAMKDINQSQQELRLVFLMFGENL
jgi:hypothetical protein